jgi:hypothetical protein
MMAMIGGDWRLTIPIVIGVFVVFVLVFQLLWNTTMPQVFRLPQITFWQAFRLLLMASILFGGVWARYSR